MWPGLFVAFEGVTGRPPLPRVIFFAIPRFTRDDFIEAVRAGSYFVNAL
jgi:hypothetical protein